MKLTWTLQIFISWRAAMAGNYEKLSPILRGNYNNRKHFYISKYQPYGAATGLQHHQLSYMRKRVIREINRLLYKYKNISTFLLTIKIPFYC